MTIAITVRENSAKELIFFFIGNIFIVTGINYKEEIQTVIQYAKRLSQNDAFLTLLKNILQIKKIKIRIF
jgi:hypothetical protein